MQRQAATFIKYPVSITYSLSKGKTPEERAKILETTPLFADIHAQAASSGQTSVPQDLDTDLHFTCFVQAPDAKARETGLGSAAGTSMRLIELDGRRSGPLDRGSSTDLLAVSNLGCDTAEILNDASYNIRTLLKS